MTVEPENKAIAEKLAWATKRRKDGYPTIPSTIEEELATNPFMRVSTHTRGHMRIHRGACVVRLTTHQRTHR